jgi:UDP-glucuronate 4-epimerase
MAGTKRILLTGCAGFIGSHALEALVRSGAQVTGVDNLNAYYSPERKRANLAEVRTALGAVGSYEMVEGDLRDEHLLDRLFAGPRFDCIVHLAAMPGVRASMDAPQLYVDVNLKATLSLLERAKQHDVSQFVFASTSSVYGATECLPFIETDACDRPLAPYPASKRAAELMAYSYHHLYGLPITCLRFFTVYGPRGRPDMMTYKVVDAMFSGASVPLYNGGRLLRDWTYVGDTVKGICSAVERPVGYEVINLGRGEPVVLTDYIAQLEHWSGRKARFTDVPAPKSDMEQTCANIDKARQLLGYRPSVSLADGTRAFWEWYERSVLA